MEEYLDKMLSQIRCKKARPYISDEIRSHIEDQISDNMAQGMDLAEAEEKAVADMGDPIETGISLDRIHKPRTAWNFLVIMGIVSVLGIGIQWSILHQLGDYDLEPYMQDTFRATMTGFVSSVVLGFMIMCVIYFIDYTTIAKYAKFIGVFIIGFGVLLLAGFFGRDINGMHYYVGFGMFRLSGAAFMMFYVPIYGAILYQYRGGGMSSLLKAVVWLVVPFCITLWIPNLMTAGILGISMLLLLTTAIIKKWFRVPVKRTIAVLWSVFLILPVATLFLMSATHLLSPYQKERVQAFLTTAGDQSYMVQTLRNFSRDIALFGNSGKDVIGSVTDFNKDHIFSYILNSYGSIAGILIIAVLAALIIFIFATAVKQKNELGLVMGVGCGMVLALNMIMNLLITTGVMPSAASFLPFFSAGRSNITLCYALVGIIMSVYRYKDVYPPNIRTAPSLLSKRPTVPHVHSATDAERCHIHS